MARQNYQVLARKWRPQQFEDVVGQRAVVQTLTNALDQGRMAHAYCFSGIRGVGKTTIARLLARGLNCRFSDTPTSTPCGECESCVEIMGSRALDVFERDAASDRGINEMKELIEIARYAPARDRYKVMILDEAHMLTTEASNALLKVLEEPPEYIVFVLATTEPHKILPTILSRCQHYQFARISQREIGAHLGRIAATEGIDISADGVSLVAAAADGSLRDAQSLLDKLIAFAGEKIDESTVVDLLGLVDRMLLYRATDLVAAGDVAGALGLVNEMVEQGIDLHQFTIDLLGHFRNLLVVHSVADPGKILHLPAADIDRLREQADQFQVDDLDRAFALLAGNEYRIKMAEQPRYHVEVVLARLARMPSLQPIQSLIEALGSPPGNRGDGSSEAGPSRQGSGGRGSTRGAGSSAVRAQPAKAPTPVSSPVPTVAPVPTAMAAAAPPPTPSPPAPPASAPAPSVTPVPVPPAAEEQPPPPPEPDAPPVRQVDSPPVAREPVHTTAAIGDHAALLTAIQQSLEASHPLVAQVLGRVSGVDLDDNTLTLRFPSSASIFAQRVRDPQILPALSAACSSAAGRVVKARVELDEGDPRGSVPASRDAGALAPGGPASTRQLEPTPANDTVTATSDVQGASSAFLKRAETEPLVQDLLRELKGQVISVEES